MLHSAPEGTTEDARIAFYYGRELYYRGMYKEAAEQLNYFFTLPGATWVGDRSDALLIISRCTNELIEARQWARLAIQETPDRREGYVRMATICYHTEDHKEALMYAERAIAIKERPLQYVCEDWAWDWKIYDIAAICAWTIGDAEKAREYGAQALSMNPQHERLKKNIEYYLG